MAFTAEYIYKLVDKYSRTQDNITRSTKKFQKAATAASRRVSKYSQKLQGMGQSMANFRTLIGGAAITAGMLGFARKASAMEDSMQDVSRVTGLTGAALGKLQSKLQGMGRATGKSAIGLAAIAYEGGKLGITNENMAGFVLMVTKTAAAFDMLDSEAGRAVGSIRAKLGLSVDSVNELMQRVNFLADNTSATGSKMIEIIERTSGTFKTLHIPRTVTAGWAAFADQIEVTPQLAASGLNQMMAKMMQMPGMLSQMLDDPQNAVIDFLKRFESMPEAQRGVAVLKTFGLEAGRFVLKAVSNTKLLDEAMMKAASSKALGSMDREFANILSRSSTAGKRVKETFIDIARAVGAVLLGVFNKYAGVIQRTSESMLRFVKLHPGLVKLVAVISLALLAVVAIALPIGILFSILAAGLPVLASVAGAVGAISWPVVLVVALVAALAAWFVTAYVKSVAFRDSLANLVDAFGPLIHGLKLAVMWVGSKLGMSLDSSGSAIKIWGDVFANVINMVAGLFKGVFDLVGSLGTAMGALSMGKFGDAWAAVKEGVGLAPSQDKASGRSGSNNKTEVTGSISVSASNGAVIDSADIGLDTGYNLAGM